jgi:hypothetical protein
MRALLCAALVLLVAAPAASAGTRLTTGTLTGANGQPAAGEVRLYAFPITDRALKLPLVGSALAGPDGAFTIDAIDDRQLLRLARQRDGWLDFTAVADAGGYQGTWSFTLFVDARGGAVRAVTPDAVTTTDGVARAASRPLTAHIAVKTGRAVPSHAYASQTGQCKNERQERPRKVTRELAIVGELNNAYNDGTRGKFTYSRNMTADTSFGIAESYDLGETWYITGETHISDKGSVTFPRALRRYARKLKSLFEFTKYQVRNNTCAVWDTYIRATAWVDGTNSETRQKGTLDKCDREKFAGFEGDAAFHRSRKEAVRWNRGVNAFGVYLTTQSGFSENVALDYSFGGPRRKRHFLCGADGVTSPYASGRVFSGARPR